MREVIYKKIGDRELHLIICEPKGWSAMDRRPCYMAIHGGGWTGGSARAQLGQATYFSKLGMVGASLEYRFYDAKTGGKVEDSVADARSAVRYLRTHAAELGIDPDKIIVGGVSAGEHLAAGTFLFDDINSSWENTDVSSVPAALLLFCPVLDTSTAGYGNHKAGADWQKISGLLRVRAGMPPTMIFHTKTDDVVPFHGTGLFLEATKKAGNKCELVTYETGKHCFMTHDKILLKEALDKASNFLQPLGLMPEKTAAAP